MDGWMPDRHRSTTECDELDGIMCWAKMRSSGLFESFAISLMVRLCGGHCRFGDDAYTDILLSILLGCFYESSIQFISPRFFVWLVVG